MKVGMRAIAVKRFALKIETLSRQVAEQGSSSDPIWDEARQLLLVCETSCFVYWNAEFWFDQADSFLGKLEASLPITV